MCQMWQFWFPYTLTKRGIFRNNSCLNGQADGARTGLARAIVQTLETMFEMRSFLASQFALNWPLPSSHCRLIGCHKGRHGKRRQLEYMGLLLGSKEETRTL